MTLEQLLFRLEQKTLLQSLSTLSPEAKNKLFEELSRFDLVTLEKQINSVLRNAAPTKAFTPYRKPLLKDFQTAFAKAAALFASGKVGTIVLAGGQGTRLNYDLPKGLFPLSIIKQKSAFQLVAEKAVAIGACHGKTPHIAIMTSESTHKDTVEHFQKAAYFGLPKEHVHFFMQGSLPLLHGKGELALDEAGSIRTGPDGNGAIFTHFAAQGLLQKWKALGIEHTTVIQIDNPLADPFPLDMLAAHLQAELECTAAAILRYEPEEKVGVFVEQENHLAVIEYSEMIPEEFFAQDSKGNFKHPLANISYFLFSLAFIEKAAATKLPLHKAKKKVPGTNLELWKFEYFIFDLLELATKAALLLRDRATSFAPLKNAHGAASITSVQKALLERDREQFFRISGVQVQKERLFELAMPFYYPTNALIAKWRGKPLPQTAYIEP